MFESLSPSNRTLQHSPIKKVDASAQPMDASPKTPVNPQKRTFSESAKYDKENIPHLNFNSSPVHPSEIKRASLDINPETAIQMAVAASTAAMKKVSTPDLLARFKTFRQAHDEKSQKLNSPPRTEDERKKRMKSKALFQTAQSPRRKMPPRTDDRKIRQAMSKTRRQAQRNAAQELITAAEVLHLAYPPVKLGEPLPYASKLSEPIKLAEYAHLPEYTRLGAMSREDFIGFMVSKLAESKKKPALMSINELKGLVSKVQGAVGEFFEQLLFRAAQTQNGSYRHSSSQKTPGEPYMNFNDLTHDPTFKSVDSIALGTFRQVKTSCRENKEKSVEGIVQLIKQGLFKSNSMTEELLFRQVEGRCLLQYLQDTVNEILPHAIQKERFDLSTQTHHESRMRLDPIMELMIQYAVPDDLVEDVSQTKGLGHLTIVGLGATTTEIADLTKEIILKRVAADVVGPLQYSLYSSIR